MTMLIWLHVACMFVGFSTLVAADAVVIFASLIRDSASLRSLIGASNPLGNTGKVATLFGIAVGLHLAYPYGYGSLWLVLSYVLVGLTIAFGIFIIDPFKRRLVAAASEGDAALAQGRRSPGPPAILFINTACWIAILWLMLAKP